MKQETILAFLIAIALSIPTETVTTPIKFIGPRRPDIVTGITTEKGLEYWQDLSKLGIGR